MVVATVAVVEGEVAAAAAVLTLLLTIGPAAAAVLPRATWRADPLRYPI
jgi:hypothetical protein